MNNPNKKLEDMTWIEKINLMRILSEYPAVTIMMFLRERVGFRVIKLGWFYLLTAILLISPLLMPPLAKPFSFPIILYAFVMLGLAVFGRWKQWKDLCNNVRWHTRSPGISFLERLPWLPVYFKSHYRVHRYLDPAVAILAGAIISPLCHALGLWIMVSGFFLHVHEEECYKRAVNEQLDILDNMIESEEKAEIAKRYAKGENADAPSRPLEETGGIPTGLAPDIAVLVVVRRAKQRRPAPDNMARETPQDWGNDESRGPVIDQLPE